MISNHAPSHSHRSSGTLRRTAHRQDVFPRTLVTFTPDRRRGSFTLPYYLISSPYVQTSDNGMRWRTTVQAGSKWKYPRTTVQDIFISLSTANDPIQTDGCCSGWPCKRSVHVVPCCSVPSVCSNRGFSPRQSIHPASPSPQDTKHSPWNSGALTFLVLPCSLSYFGV